MCGLQAITTGCPHPSRASRGVPDAGTQGDTGGHRLLSRHKVSSVILRLWQMHPIAGSPGRARGFARIVSIRARWNPAAGPSFCYASYPAAIPDSPNTRGCRCFPAPDTRKTRSILPRRPKKKEGALADAPHENDPMLLLRLRWLRRNRRVGRRLGRDRCHAR